MSGVGGVTEARSHSPPLQTPRYRSLGVRHRRVSKDDPKNGEGLSAHPLSLGGLGGFCGEATLGKHGF